MTFFGIYHRLSYSFDQEMSEAANIEATEIMEAGDTAEPGPSGVSKPVAEKFNSSTPWYLSLTLSVMLCSYTVCLLL